MSSIDTLRVALFGDPPSDSYKPNRDGVIAAAIEARAENLAEITPYADAAASSAADAAAVAAIAGAYPNSAASNVPRGLTQASVGAITAGSGGTNGTFALAWSGGNFSINPTGTFTVSGGALTAVTITGPGLYIGSSPTVPTPSFAASSGLTGAGVALTAQFLVASGNGYWVQASDGSKISHYLNSSGVATADASVGPIYTSPSVAGTSEKNLIADGFFRSLYAAYPTPATSMSLYGSTQIGSSDAGMSWDSTSSPFGNHALVTSAGDFFAYPLTGMVFPVSLPVMTSLEIKVPTGTTLTASLLATYEDATTATISGPTSIVGDDTMKRVDLAAGTLSATKRATSMRIRITRTVGTGQGTFAAVQINQGVIARPFGEVVSSARLTTDETNISNLNSATVNNLFVDPFFRGLHDAYPTAPAILMALDGNTQVGYVDVPTWDTATSPFGNPSLVIGAGADIFAYPRLGSTYRNGMKVTTSMWITVPVGTTISFQMFGSLTPSGLTSVAGPTSIVGTGSPVRVDLSALTLPASVINLRIRLTRTAGSGSGIVHAVQMVEGAVALPFGEAFASRYDLRKQGAGLFYGKTWASFGDSITQQGYWQPTVTTILGLGAHTNCGVGGSMVSKPDASGTQVSMCDDARINAIPSTVKLIVFMGTTNDFGAPRALGAITDLGVTSFDNTTVYGALEEVATKLLARFNAGQMIVWMTPFIGEWTSRLPGWPTAYKNNISLIQDDYNNAVRAVAKKYGFPLIDLHDRLGWNTVNLPLFLQNESGQYIHPTSDVGGPRMGALIADELQRLAHTAALIA